MTVKPVHPKITGYVNSFIFSENSEDKWRPSGLIQPVALAPQPEARHQKQRSRQ